MRITAGDYDLGFRISSTNAADCSAGILVSGGGYGACVEDDNSGFGRIACAFQSPIAELTLDGGAVGLSRPAPEIFHVEGRHMSILA